MKRVNISLEDRHKRAEKILLRFLTFRQRDMIRIENPFRSERNKLIRLLRKKGVSRVLLERISGLSPTAIQYILRGKPKSGKGLATFSTYDPTRGPDGSISG